MTDAPDPGIYYDVPDAEYRAWPYISQSELSLFRDDDLCELEIKHALETPREDTEFMRLGRMIEAAVDGLPVGEEVQCLPPEIKQRRGVAWQEFQRANPGTEFLPPGEYAKHGEAVEAAKAMAANVLADPLAGKLLDGAKRQVSFVHDFTFTGPDGEPMTVRGKGRLDYWRDDLGMIADLKSTSYGGPRAVGRWAWNHGWDIQAAWYTDAMRGLTGNDEIGFYYIVVRTCKPYVVSLYNGHDTQDMAGNLLNIGRRAYQVYAERLTECRKSGIWRGYYTEDAPDSRIMSIWLPPYAA